MATNWKETLETDAAKPKSGAVDGQSVTNRSIGEIIQAAKFAAANDADLIANPASALKLMKIQPPNSD
jgi:hypothetical protein